MAMHLKSFANNGQGVSTLERDEFAIEMAQLFGADLARYELAVFKDGVLQSEGAGLTEEEIIPVHVEYFDTYEEATLGHEAVLDAINNGTLEYSGVPEVRR